MPARIAEAASVSEKSSGFIIDVQRNGPEFLDSSCELLDLETQLFRALFTEFFLGYLLEIHCLSMLPFSNFPAAKLDNGC